jgi:hypothetical protein
MNTLKYSWKTKLTVHWQVGGVFFNLKGMINHMNAPHSVMKAILYRSSGAIMI